MTTPSGTSRHAPDRALPPIRWPHPGWQTLALILLWLVGMLVAVFVPALIVPPSQPSAPTDQVLLALGCTFLGAAIMFAVGIVFWRRHEDPVATAFGVVPAIAVGVGGLIMAVMSNGMQIMGVDQSIQQVVKGLVLLLAVAFDVYNKRRAGSSR